MLTKTQIARIQGRFRIPVDAFCPGHYWIISIDRESLIPTDQELAQLSSYREFVVLKTYRETYGRQILKMPLPFVPGHNTAIFRKGAPLNPEDNGWFLRKSTWREGPLYIPNVAGKDYCVHTLVEIIDRYEDIIPEKWERCKLDHPKIFPK